MMAILIQVVIGNWTSYANINLLKKSMARVQPRTGNCLSGNDARISSELDSKHLQAILPACVWGEFLINNSGRIRNSGFLSIGIF